MERLTVPPIGLYCYNIAPYDVNGFVEVKVFNYQILLIYYLIGSYIFNFDISFVLQNDKWKFDWMNTKASKLNILNTES